MLVSLRDGVRPPALRGRLRWSLSPVCLRQPCPAVSSTASLVVTGTRLERPPDSMDTTGRAVSRRDWLKLAAGGGAALAFDGVLDVPAVQAASRQFKLANV